MTAAWLALAGLSALALYLASARQRLRAAPLPRPRLVRAAGWLLLLASAVVAGISLGAMPGTFAALTAWMLFLVALPLLGAVRNATS